MLERVAAKNSSALRIVVLGYLVRGPVGGLASYHLQYLTGLVELGHDVHFLEDSDDYPSCYDPSRDVTDEDPAYGLRFAENTLRRAGLEDRWAYYDAHTSRWIGPCSDRALEICRASDLLIDVAGLAPMRPWFMEIDARALIDQDPVFTQIRHLTDPEARERAMQHTSFFTLGENVGRGSDIPADGFPWQPTRQPVVLGSWRVSRPPADAKFTTVMQWDSYPMREFRGRRYGMKSDSFAPFLELPARVGPILELAVGSASAPRALLRSKGWSVCDPREPTRDPWTYRGYIEASKAEFSVAKHGYVVTRSGWFSDRSAAYLASGRPVLLQETGFSDWLESGRGVLSFRTLEEAAKGVEEIQQRYELHARAAREIAEAYFDSRKILSSLVEAALAPRHPGSEERAP
jgi:hypothetical protein